MKKKKKKSKLNQFSLFSTVNVKGKYYSVGQYARISKNRL